MIRFTALAVLFVTVFIVSIGFNVLVHEGAHYAVADKLDLEPEIYFNKNVDTKALYSIDSEIAYVQYSSSSSAAEDAMIAVAGPLANLSIFLFALMFYMNPKRSNTGKLLLIVILVTSFVSFAVNMLPFSPGDGYYILGYLLG